MRIVLDIGCSFPVVGEQFWSLVRSECGHGSLGNVEILRDGSASDADGAFIVPSVCISGMSPAKVVSPPLLFSRPGAGRRGCSSPRRPRCGLNRRLFSPCRSTRRSIRACAIHAAESLKMSDRIEDRDVDGNADLARPAGRLPVPPALARGELHGFSPAARVVATIGHNARKLNVIEFGQRALCVFCIRVLSLSSAATWHLSRFREASVARPDRQG